MMTMTAKINVPARFGQGNQGPSDPAAPRERIARAQIKKFLNFVQHTFAALHTDDTIRIGVTPFAGYKYMAALFAYLDIFIHFTSLDHTVS